jgi:hypothetical protein
MNKLISMAALALAVAAPVSSFAQSGNQPVTRAEVRAQIVQLERAGYNPGVVRDSSYPADIQAAQARVDAQQGYGGAADGAAQSGARAGVPVQPQDASLYSRH